MNLIAPYILAFAVASIVALIVIPLRQRRDVITPPSVPLQRVSKSPRYTLQRDGGVILEALALCLCSWALLGALWFITTGIFSLSIQP